MSELATQHSAELQRLKAREQQLLAESAEAKHAAERAVEKAAQEAAAAKAAETAEAQRAAEKAVAQAAEELIKNAELLKEKASAQQGSTWWRGHRAVVHQPTHRSCLVLQGTVNVIINQMTPEMEAYALSRLVRTKATRESVVADMATRYGGVWSYISYPKGSGAEWCVDDASSTYAGKLIYVTIRPPGCAARMVVLFEGLGTLTAD
jgi:hypothetical protein